MAIVASLMGAESKDPDDFYRAKAASGNSLRVAVPECASRSSSFRVDVIVSAGFDSDNPKLTTKPLKGNTIALPIKLRVLVTKMTS